MQELECGFAEQLEFRALVPGNVGIIGPASITRGSYGEVQRFRYKRIGGVRFGIGEDPLAYEVLGVGKGLEVIVFSGGSLLLCGCKESWLR